MDTDFMSLASCAPHCVEENLEDIRNHYDNALQVLSAVVATEGCKYALRFQLALTAKKLKAQKYGQYTLSKYLTDKRDAAKWELRFATECIKILKKSEAVDVDSLREEVRFTLAAEMRTLAIVTVSDWVLNDGSLQTRKSELLIIFDNLKVDAQNVLQFVEEVRQFLEVDPRNDEETESGVFEYIIAEARDKMLALLGESSHSLLQLKELAKEAKRSTYHQLEIQPNVSLAIDKRPKDLKIQHNQVEAIFEEFAVTGHQNNCVFQALSLSLNKFTDQSRDVELRAKTMWQLVEDWHDYSARYFADNDEAQTVAMENLLWSLRRFNAFSCRLIHVLPKVLNKDVEMLIVSFDGCATRLSLHFRQAAEASVDPAKVVYLAARENNFDHNQRSPILYHVTALNPKVNVNNLQLAEARDVPLFGAYSRFGGGESNLQVCDKDSRTIDKNAFNWELHKLTLLRAKNQSADPEVARAYNSAKMSIYGLNTHAMRQEYDRLQKLMAQDALIEKYFGPTAQHLKQEIERLELAKYSANPVIKTSSRELIKTVEKVARGSIKQAKSLLQVANTSLDELNLSCYVRQLFSKSRQIETSFSRRILNAESDTLAKVIRNFLAGSGTSLDPVMLDNKLDAVSHSSITEETILRLEGVAKKDDSSESDGDKSTHLKREETAFGQIRVENSVSIAAPETPVQGRQLVGNSEATSEIPADTSAAEAYLKNLVEVNQGSTALENSTELSDMTSCLARLNGKLHLICCSAESLYVTQVKPQICQRPSKKFSVAKHKMNFIQSITYVNRIGIVVLSDESDSPQALHQEVQLQACNKYAVTARLQLNVFEWETCEAVSRTKLVQDYSYQSIMTLHPTAEDRLLILNHDDVLATEVGLSDTKSATPNKSVLTVTHRPQLPWNSACYLQKFVFNVRCAHALAICEKSATIYSFSQAEDFVKRAEVPIRREFKLNSCFVSGNAYCLLSFTDSKSWSGTSLVVMLYNLDGVELSCFNALQTLHSLPFQSHDIVFFNETNDAHELSVFFVKRTFQSEKSACFFNFAECAASDEKEVHAFAISTQADCRNELDIIGAKLKSFFKIDAKRADKGPKRSNDPVKFASTKMTDSQIIAIGACPSDFEKPYLISCVKIQGTLFVVDGANSALKRIENLSKTESDATVLWMTDAQNADERLTGMCAVDEQTLVVVQGFYKLTFLRVKDSRTIKVYSVCLRSHVLRDDYLNGWNYRWVFIFAINSERFVLAIENGECLFDVRLRSDSRASNIVKSFSTESALKSLTHSKAKGYFSMVTGKAIKVLNEDLLVIFVLKLPDFYAPNLLPVLHFYDRKCLAMLDSLKQYSMFIISSDAEDVEYLCSMPSHPFTFTEFDEKEVTLLQSGELRKVSIDANAGLKSSCLEGKANLFKIFDINSDDFPSALPCGYVPRSDSDL